MGNAKITPQNYHPSKKLFFLPYQKAWITDRSRFKLMEKSRQVGMSWATAYDCARFHALASCKHDTWVTSRDEIQARLFIQDAGAFTKILKIAASDFGEVVLDSERDLRAYAINFANSTHIYSMSSNPDAQAGKRGTRVIDEWALHRDPKKLFDIAKPGLTWGGQLAGISTHRGSKNYFNTLVREAKEGENPKGISLHTVTLQGALEQGFLTILQRKLPESDPVQAMDESAYFDFVKSGCSDEESFLQEYMCVPADDNSMFIDIDLLALCEYESTTQWEKPLESCGELFVGVDVGRKNDLTVFWVAEKVGTRLETRRIDILKNCPFRDQKTALFDLLKRPNMHRACMDASGLGMQLAEEAHDAFGHRAEPCIFSAQLKERLAFRLKSKMEARDFKLPFSPAIRDDFRAIKKEVTASGNIRFSAERSENGHADRFWSAALCVEALGNDLGLAWIEPASSVTLSADDFSQDEDDLNHTRLEF